MKVASNLFLPGALAAGRGWLPALFLCFLGAFFSGGSPAAGADAKGEPVVLQLKWFHQFQFAGYYAAEERGFYRDAGLRVEIREGSPRTDAVEEVASGRANFGISNSDLLIRRFRGDPVVVLAAIFQHSPLVIVATEASGIQHPQHMRGMRVGISRSTRDAELLAMLANEGVSLDEIRPPEGGSFSFSMYYDGSADAGSAYLTNEPFLLEKKGIPFRLIRPLTYGIDFFGDCLFTSESEVARHPGRVRRFREASLRGWEWAMAHPEETAGLIIERYGSGKPRDHLLYEAEKMQELVLPRLVEIGHMNPGRWRHIADTFANLGMIDGGYGLDGFLYDPDPRPNLAEIHRFLVILALAGSAVGVGVFCLLAFNRRLRKEVKERLEAERTLRLQAELMDQIQDVILATDAHGSIRYVNDAALRTLRKSREELIGQNIRLLEQDESMASQREIMEKTLACGRWRGRVAHRRPDGSCGLFETRTWIVRGGKGEPAGMVGVSTDITERVRMEEDLVAARNQAVAANRAKSAFLANMSHELRTPLNAILGYSRLLTRGRGVSPEEGLDIIHSSGRHLLSLIDDILDLSRLETGKGQLTPETVALKPFLKTIAGMIAVQARRKSLDWRFEPSANLPAAIAADPVRLRQILLNLLNNAVKFTDSGQVRFAVDRLSEEGGGLWLRFEVSDTGKGIAAEDLDRIFRPFEQAGAWNGHPGGTGLGLPISRNLARLMGGEIQVSARRGEGSRFWLDALFPLRDCPEERTPGPGRRILGFDGPARSILVVDDRPENGRFLKDALSPLGFKVHIADTGGGAVRTAARRLPDLVLMDLVLPDMDGFEAARRIREETGLVRVPVIAVSASFLGRTTGWVREKGLQGFLPKPVDLDKLCGLLAEWLDLRWLEEGGAGAEIGMEAGANVGPPLFPPEAALSPLRRMADGGLVFEIMAEARRIQSEDPRFSPFSERLLALASRFEVNRIQAFLRGETGE